MPNHTRALSPVQTETGALVHTSADRQLASGHWLLSTLPGPARDRARQEWHKKREALVPTGTLFSAVKLPSRLLLAAASEPQAASLRAPSPQLDEFLREALVGTPVICDPRSLHYYALVPASLPGMWHRAAAAWPYVGVHLLGRGGHVGVPRPDATELDPKTYSSYWAVPMVAMGLLGDAPAVARLIAAGCHQLAEEVIRAQA
ncbi:hypothetical protein [Streptomyces soliscabiei]|uniref:hypothetical protein n=1 Tax=Streptomyces soliscabiei TaxID=588897 RepID=UPI0029B346E8|nr:hypothetical protein [Streptomyces sp. NY05-11A]MDX2681121.1 hypothetical protein [Streptomyces sp. NY05-11A]